MNKQKLVRRGLLIAIALQVINLVYVVMADPATALVGAAILIIIGVLTLIMLWVTTNAVAEAFREALGNDDDDDSADDESGEEDTEDDDTSEGEENSGSETSN